MPSIGRKLCISLFLAAVAALPALAATYVPSAPLAPAPAPAPLAAPEQKKPEPIQTAPDVRIGYVDVLRVGNDSLPGKAAQARYKAKAEQYKVQIEAKQKQLEKQKSAIEAKLPSLSPEQRAAKAKAFDKKVEEYRKFVQNAEKEMKPLEEELSRSLIEMIGKAAGDYARANGYAAIVVKKELLYQGSVVVMKDLTEEILKLVDEKGQEK